MFKKILTLLIVVSFFQAPVFAEDEEKEVFLEQEEFMPVLFPKGDAEKGKEWFGEFQCTSCHMVEGVRDLPKPVSANPGPVLGSVAENLPVGWIIDSIVSPSHSVRLGAEGGPTLELKSAMGDFTDVMTVRQLIDIVTFLKVTQDRQSDPEQNNGN